ncbi:hypothetical protein Syun_005707 [Stephania yunnanensis]|uniref:Uncharacterized protein n=1 Tax=Stephania yunnanensis TaxID=152371 RepID=A0AAP0L7Z3_9MAGN
MLCDTQFFERRRSQDLCEDDEDIYEDEEDDDRLQEDNISIHQSPIWIAKRDALAELMWNEYN